MELKKNFYWPLCIFLIFYVALFCILALFNWPRPGDDFGYFSDITNKGFFNAQVFTFTQWTGRVFGTFLIDLVLMIFPLEIEAQAVPLITILTYAASIFVFIKVFLPSEISLKTKMLLTLIATASTLAFNYLLGETLYWLCGSTYFWCTSLILFAVSLAVKALRGSRPAFLLCMLIIFLNGTTLEQPCIFEGILAFAAMIYFAWQKDKKRALICMAFWFSAILAFSCLYFAPGTALRMTSLNNGSLSFISRFAHAVAVAGTHSIFTIIKFFVKPLVYVFLLFLPLIAKTIPQSKLKLKSWQIIILTALIAPLMQFLQAWSLGTGLQNRAVSLTLWFMGFIWFLLWSLFYSGKLTSSPKFEKFSAKFRYPFLIFALLISFNFIDVISSLKIAPAYRAENISRVQSIAAQKADGAEDILITRLENKPFFLYEDLGFMPETYSFAEYYGVKSVLAIPKNLSGDVEAVNELRKGNLKPLIKIADQDPEIQYKLALHSDPIYNSPFGLEMSLEEAEKWNRAGAANGHALCMRALSRVIYTKNKSLNGILEALYWLAKSQLITLRL